MWMLGLFAFFMSVHCSFVVSSKASTVSDDTQSNRCANILVYIPFIINEEIYRNFREEILTSLTYYENKTSLRFKEVKSYNITDPIFNPNSPILHFKYVEFEILGFVYTDRNQFGKLVPIIILYEKDPQSVNSVSRVKQQIYSALGFLPEIMRPDRDNYVAVLRENIEPFFTLLYDATSAYVHPSFEKVFSRKCIEAISRFPYDFLSISHYHPTYFSKDGKPTLFSKDEKTPLRRNTELSPSDIEKINICYCDEQFGNP